MADSAVTVTWVSTVPACRVRTEEIYTINGLRLTIEA
jgi:hypothetical protein